MESCESIKLAIESTEPEVLTYRTFVKQFRTELSAYGTNRARAEQISLTMFMQYLREVQGKLTNIV